MLDTTENTNVQEVEKGIETMSVMDALNFAETGETPKKAIKEEVVESNEELIAENQEVVKEKEVVEENIVEVKEEIKPEVKVETIKDEDDFLDEDDKAYLAFKKANKTATRADYEKTKVDYEKIDRKTLLRQSLREKYSLTESDDDLDDYISSELGISMDADESEMTLAEKVALKNLTDDYISSKKEEQKKWLTPDAKAKEEASKEEMVTLENGQQMPKKEYDIIVENRNKYLKNNEEALNRVNATSFKIEVDDNGTKKELEYAYEFSKEDKQRLLSISSDPIAHFNKTHATKDGFDHDKININQAWADPQLREKMVKSMLQKAYAEAIEDSFKEQGNINIGSQKTLKTQERKGIKVVPMAEFLRTL